MKLDKSQRFTAYCIMQHEAKSKYWPTEDMGLCHLIRSVFGLYDIGFVDVLYRGSFEHVIDKYFPELESKKFTVPGRCWPPKDIAGWKERIELLKQCILETHP